MTSWRDYFFLTEPEPESEQPEELFDVVRDHCYDDTPGEETTDGDIAVEVLEWSKTETIRRRLDVGVPLRAVLEHALCIPVRNHDRDVEMRVARVLRRMGWESHRVQLEGERVTLWRPYSIG